GPKGQVPVPPMPIGPKGQVPVPPMPIGPKGQVPFPPVPTNQTGQNSPQGNEGFDNFFKNLLKPEETNPVNGQRLEIKDLIKIISKLDGSQIKELSNEIQKLADTKSKDKEDKPVSSSLLKNIFDKLSLSQIFGSPPSNSPQKPTAKPPEPQHEKNGPTK
ncbi:MAG: hypothetical protein EBT63_05750, partial [Proteobacteria bacterium]|nr:hypothetical protein [Pseudomonadota bacterium]